MADYEVLAPGGHENLINNVTERLDEKAYIDGYYQQLTAGAADSLTGRGDGVSASYLYRTTGGDADVADGTATVKSIHGRTVVWGQYAQAWTGTTRGVTFTGTDGLQTISGTATDNATSRITTTAVTIGHKYLVKLGGLRFGSDNTATLRAVRDYNAAGNLTAEENARIIDTSNSVWVEGNVLGIQIVANTGTVADTSFYPQIFDLTSMFGSGNEPSTVAEFEALFPEPYYPYDAGSLLSVQMDGIETVGFNQWDEEWELGTINANNGTNVSSNTYIRSTNHIPVFPGQTYYFKGKAYFWAYAADKSYVGRISHSGMGGTGTVDNNTITIPNNVSYLRFVLTADYGTTYNHDICINLSWSGYRDGEYEPYWKSERPIPAATYFPNGMRSAGTVYDELTSEEAVTRVGAGTVQSVGSVSTGNNVKYVTLNGTGADSYPSSSAFPTSAKTVVTDLLGVTDGTDGATRLSVGRTWTGLYAYAPLDSDDSIFDQLVGAEIHYALATPTTQPINPPLNLSYRVSDFGTERIMVPANEQSAPPTMQVVYGLNVVDTVRRLPTEYISHDSFTQFRIALGAKLGVFIIETWDETDNRYEYTINDA